MDLAKFHNLDIILLCGLYGSGKTAFARKHFRNRDRRRISRSEIRKLIYEMTNFGEQWKSENFNESDDAVVKHLERKLVEHYLFQRIKVLVVNTFVTKKSRKRFIDFTREEGKTTGVIFLNTPLKKCFELNEKNGAPVPQTVINSLYSKIELPDKSEGFQEVLIVDNS